MLRNVNATGFVHAQTFECPPGSCCPLTKPCDETMACAANRQGVLCGECKEGFSAAIGTTNCVPNSRCDQGVWLVFLLVVLPLMLVLYQTVFKPWWDNRAEVQKQSRKELIAVARRAAATTASASLSASPPSPATTVDGEERQALAQSVGRRRSIMERAIVATVAKAGIETLPQGEEEGERASEDALKNAGTLGGPPLRRDANIPCGV